MFCGETIVPEGLTGSQLSFNFTIRKKNKGAKLWLSKKGKIMGAYINDRIKVNNEEIIPNGQLSIAIAEESIEFIAGNREHEIICVNGMNIHVIAFEKRLISLKNNVKEKNIY